MAISPDPTVAEYQIGAAGTITTTPTIGTALPTIPTRQSGNALLQIPLHSGTIQLEVWIASFSTGTYTQFESDQVHSGIAWFPIRRSEMFVTFSIIWPHTSKLQVSKANPNGSGFKNMQIFQDIIRQHQQESALNSGTPQPITFTYFNNSTNKNLMISYNLPNLGNNNVLRNQANSLNDNKVVNNNTDSTASAPLQQLVYRGWIDKSEKEYARFKSTYTRSYRMNVINQQVGAGVSLTGSTLSDTISASTNAFLIPTANTVYGMNSPSWTSSPPSAQGTAIDLTQIIGAVN